MFLFSVNEQHSKASTKIPEEPRPLNNAKEVHMTMMMKKQSFSPFIIWSLIVAAACIFYGVGISHESFWFDEVYSATMADHPFLKILPEC